MTRLIRVTDVLSRVGFSRSTLWREIRAGRFPAPARISPRAVAWNEQLVEGWIRDRANAAAAQERV